MENLLSIRLYEFPRKLKFLCFITVMNLTVGVGVGLYYVFHTTQLTANGTEEHYRGSIINDDFEIPEKYPKPTSELLNTTHTHILSMTFIFLIIGGLFYFNSLITGMLKTFLIIEPFISILLTFGGIWLMRFIHSSFSYLIIISGILMYLCFFIMIITIFYELIMKKNKGAS